MTDEEYQEIKKSGKYAKESKLLLKLHDTYKRYLYLSNIESKEAQMLIYKKEFGYE